MIVAIGSFSLKKRSFLPEFLLLSKQIKQQAQKSKGNLHSELNNEGIAVFYSFTKWNSLEEMKEFVHSDYHLKALKKTQKLCKKASFLVLETENEITLETAKQQLATDTNVRHLTF